MHMNAHDFLKEARGFRFYRLARSFSHHAVTDIPAVSHPVKTNGHSAVSISCVDDTTGIEGWSRTKPT